MHCKMTIKLTYPLTVCVVRTLKIHPLSKFQVYVIINYSCQAVQNLLTFYIKVYSL